MATYPIKVLLDERRNPFIPLVTPEAIVVNNSDKTVMDLFNERYTKDEVDQIIRDLGTLQRLCGRVPTVADLPANPQPGDTYIVGPVAGNNSEWMYIGDEWEELGPMLDLSDYYTKSEVTALLASQAQSITNAYQAADTNIYNSATQYADTKAAAEANAALASARSYTDAQIAIAISGVDAALDEIINGSEEE